MPLRRCANRNVDLRPMSAALRRWIIEQSRASNVGHIGSALSIVDIVSALWGAVMVRPGTGEADRDRFILGKGHAALALYGALRWNGLMSEATFATYCRDGSHLGAHPDLALPGVDVATGSLGQGLSIGCGLAYGLRLQRSPAHVFVVLSDAECNEGQVWEAAMFAAHHKLNNLTVVVDLNGSQALGPTQGILSLSSLADRWRAFGWQAEETDGHNAGGLVELLGAPSGEPRPHAVIARTVLGKGVSFMEHRVEWHYCNLTEEQCRQALVELEAAA